MGALIVRRGVAALVLASALIACGDEGAADGPNYILDTDLGSGGAALNGSGGNGYQVGGNTYLPCDVAQVMSDHCWECHGNTTRFGAPMSLTTLGHFQALNPSGTQMSQMVTARIHDDARPMPPNPKPRLTPQEASVLDNWIASGMQGGTCTMSDQGGTGGMLMAGSGGTVDQGTGGDQAPVVGEECYTFTAHNGDKATPYAVPTTPDTYTIFHFSRPWGNDKVHGLSAKTLIDNDQAIHHWILYSAGSVQDGGISSSTIEGSHAGQFVAGWAPGAGDTIMPQGVGLQVPGQGFELEIHYNAPGPGHTDASGVELCVTKELLPNEAATHPLGQEGFRLGGAGTVCGMCDPRGSGPITIISSSPHMHLKGTRMRTTVLRAQGGQDVLIDVPFAFDGQIAYDTPMTVMPGDTLLTECFYDGPVTFGTGTSEEMCYNFVLAYPAGALAGGGGISRNGNTCIENPVLPGFGGGSGC